MTAHTAPLMWCAMQATVVACLGLAATWLLARRDPAGAAAAAVAAAVTILALTLLSPVPLARVASLSPREIASAGVADASPAPASSPTDLTGQRGLGIDAKELVERAWRALKGRIEIHRPVVGARTQSCLAIVVACGAGLGVWRLAQAGRYVAALRRGGTPVDDPAVQALFEQLRQQLGASRRTRVCESAEIRSPAVIGWRRPVVLLPARRRWTHAQLRAALAHELAHVARGDFAWRLTASVATAIHFCHPLVHLLTRRLALAQELATDRLAAAAVGGTTNYLQALSELAIRLDDSSGLRAEPIVLPTFSSHLFRRIAMLRSREGSSGGRGRSAAGAVAAAAIALAGVGIFALRGAGEAPATGALQTADMPTQTRAWHADPAAFQRAAIDLSMLPRVHQGLMVVRLHELAQNPAFAPVFTFANHQAESVFPYGREGAAPSIHFEAIDYVAGELTAEFKAKPSDSEGMHGDARANVENFVIRFVEPVDWRAWIKANVGGAEERRDGDFEYVLLPTVPATGAVRLAVAERDARTLVFAADPELLRAMAEGRGGAADATAAELWQNVEGGLVGATVPDPVLEEIAEAATGAAIDTSDAAKEWLVALCHLVRRFGVGFDLDPASNLSAVRVTLGCDDRESAEKMKAMLELWRPVALAYFQLAAVNPPHAVYDDAATMVQTAGDADTERLGAEWYLDLIKQCSVEIVDGNDGRVEVQLRSHAPFPPSIMTVYEVAEAGDAPPAATH